MIDLGLRRYRHSDRHRASATRHVALVEVLESRIAMTNGLVNIPARILSPTHNVLITSVPQDPTDTGMVSTTNLTAMGTVRNPAGGPIDSVHATLRIQVIVNGTRNPADTISWDATTGPGTITGPTYFGQDPNDVSQALFSVPFTLANTTAQQLVTFEIEAVGFGTRPVLRIDNGQPLTGTFTVLEIPVGPTITSISSIPSPRAIPVSSVDVTFSEAINPATFTTADLTLTRDTGSGPVAVPLGSEVTFTSTDNITFTVGGLASSTADPGSYSFTVDASNIADPGGTNGMGSESVDFIVESADAPPRVSDIGPITTPRTTPVSTFDVTFSKPIDPTTFTTADLALSRDNTPVPLGQDVTFSTLDNITFTVGGLEEETAAVGNYFLRVSAAGVTDMNGVPGVGSLTTSFTVESVVIDTGPTVVSLKRLGIHRQPATLVLTFDRPLDAVSAGDPKNYTVYVAGRDHRIGTADDRIVPFASGYYNSANLTVTLVMAKPVYLSQLYRLVARGTGPNPITDTNGVPLDGRNDGMPGTDYTTIFGREILASPLLGQGQTPGSRFNPLVSKSARRYQSFRF